MENPLEPTLITLADPLAAEDREALREALAKLAEECPLVLPSSLEVEYLTEAP